MGTYCLILFRIMLLLPMLVLREIRITAWNMVSSQYPWYPLLSARALQLAWLRRTGPILLTTFTAHH